MAQSENASKSNRLKLIGGIGLVGLLIAGFAIYWFLFRDDSAASVDSVAGAEARQEALDARAAEIAAEDGEEPSIEIDSGADDEGSDTEVDVGQPDSAASVGSETDGVWTVDTSLGTFDEACLTDACSATFVGFRINEELASFGAKTVVGRTPDITGSIELVGTQVAAASFTVDMTTLVTDNETRTGALRTASGGLETDTFPDAIFVLTQPVELGQVPAEGASVEVDAVGELTVHGVTRQVTIPLTAELSTLR